MQDEPEDKQSVSSDLIRGHINTIILRALYDGDKYGYEIISEIERKSHGQYTLKQPSLYSALKRLESEGYITSYWGGSVNGGRRKYFSLTDSGKKISEVNQSEWEYSRTVIDSLISDKDFDFSNPAPGQVDMRVLRDTTTRASTGSRQEDTPQDGQKADELALSEKNEELNDKQAKIVEELAKIAEERSAFEENAFRLEEERLALEDAAKKLEEERTKYETEMEARNDAFLREREWREREIAEREKRLLQEKDSLTESQTLISDEEKTALEERIRDQEAELNEQRERYEEACLSYEEEISDMKVAYEEEIARREQQIREEQEELFRKREKELLHRNFIELISTPPADTENTVYEHVSPPVGDEPPEEERLTVEEEEYDESDYRPAVRKIFANTVQTENPAVTVRETRVTSLDGIDFYDLEACAERDGIRIYTAGGKPRSVIAEQSKSVVHKGKALFISSIFFFAFCVILGSIILALSGKVALPVYYPYLIWAIGLVVLLIAGIAFANRFGEHSLRTSTPAIINAIVLYVLLVIITLIIALAVNIDFTDKDILATFVTVPVIFFAGILVFGVAYYVQVSPRN